MKGFIVFTWCIVHIHTCTVDGFSLFHSRSRSRSRSSAVSLSTDVRVVGTTCSKNNEMKMQMKTASGANANANANVNVNVNVNSSANINTNPAARTSRRHVISRTIPTLAAILVTTISCSPLKAVAKVDVSGLRMEGSTKITSAPAPSLVSPPPPKPSNPNNIIELAGVQYTPAAMILELAEQTASMEGMMRASAADIEEVDESGDSNSDSNSNSNKKRPKKLKKERIDAGARGEGPGVISRNDLSLSIRYMVKNSKAEKIAPFAAMTLNSIPSYLVIDDSNSNSNASFSFNKANNNKNATSNIDMTLEDYLMVAQKYERAREELRLEFEKMTKEEQEEGKIIVRAIRRRDQERMAIQLGIRADE
uniref:Uncharacterized protein n=2 Tax=Chaetoceros debilis TaxID=122233 RepID=A0A7S3VAB6_9STRA